MSRIESYPVEALVGPLSEHELPNAPEALYLAGRTELLEAGPRVSVVGSRRADSDGLAMAKEVSLRLVKAGAVVVSGLAEGVDTMAHRTAMAAGGHTIAVLGTPLDRCYPASNRALQERIMEEHLAVSQFPTGRSPGRGSFPRRNRTMALLTHATIIVQAGESSGTRHQGWEAIRLGRAVFLSPLIGENPPSWASEMIDYGAEFLPLSSVADVVAELPDPRVDVAAALGS